MQSKSSRKGIDAQASVKRLRTPDLSSSGLAPSLLLSRLDYPSGSGFMRAPRGSL